MYFSLILELLHLDFTKSRKTVSLKEEGTCGGLTLAGYQVPTKAALSLPQVDRRENIMKGSWVKTRETTPSHHHRPTLGKIILIYYQ